jgi:hypothetical protein
MDIQELNWPGVFCSGFMAVVFLQSGLDKVFNFKQELGWIQQKFVRNPLYGYVKSLLVLLTAMECLSGALSAVGALQLLTSGEGLVAWNGMLLSAATMLALIFGQRVSKDYSGAATLVPYFIVSILGLYTLMSTVQL